ncbi:MAG: HEPN domain-containing protein [Psychromonas sp.]
MASRSQHQGHDKYKSRIIHLFKLYAEDINTETQADNAKYLAVLVSGYLEQAIKEILLQYASSISAKPISKYIKETWPTSKNMTATNIESILEQFNEGWSKEFSDWLKVTKKREGRGNRKEDRKGDINSIVKWRNYIAHGQESKTTGVTLVSVKEKFITIKDLVSLIETMVKS